MTVLLIGSVIAGGDNKDSQKSKRAYSLGYGYDPYYDVIDHAPLASAAVVHHAPVAAVHHASFAAPIVAAAPAVVAHAPAVVAHAPVVAPLAKVTSSVVSTNIHHYPSYTPYNSYIASHAPYNSYVASHAPIVASPYYHAPAAAVVAPAAYAHSPVYTSFHRR